jgi:putative phosphonate metabolism protein
MIMTERFAIYLVPPAGSALWDRGCRWLGRDPETGAVYAPPSVPGIAADEIRALTQMPRDYGFHGTLKAPFRLAQGVDEAELLERVGRLARSVPVVTMPQLQVDRLSDFLALRPAGAGTTVGALAAHFVTGLDDFRAPIESADRARRLSSGLSARQQELLERWGYPYVLDEFRFHMTLSGRLDPMQSERLQPWIEEWFAPALAEPPEVVDIGVFMQRGADAEFVLHRRYRMAA